MIGIVTTQQRILTNYLRKGIKDHTLINSSKTLYQIQNCDAICVGGFRKRPPTNSLKTRAIEIAERHNIPVVFIDSAIFSDKNVDPPRQKFHTVTINGPKALGLDYLNYTALNPNQWEKVSRSTGIEIRKKILSHKNVYYYILRHNSDGYFADFYTKTRQKDSFLNIKKELTGGKLPFKISDHPKDLSVNSYTINEIVADAKCCITWMSNASAFAVINRIPIISLSNHNYFHIFNSSSFAGLFYPTETQIYNWLNFITNSQFTTDEICNGTMFRTISPYIYDKCLKE